MRDPFPPDLSHEICFSWVALIDVQSGSPDDDKKVVTQNVQENKRD
jgi:hypothetical protein